MPVSETTLQGSSIAVELLKQVPTILITVLGWLVAFWLMTQQLKRDRRLGCLIEVRSELTTAFRAYEQWCADLLLLASRLRMSHQLATSNAGQLFDWSADRMEWCKSANGLLHSDIRFLRWIERLEDYEIVLPETRQVRIELLKRNRVLSEQGTQLWNAVFNGDPNWMNIAKDLDQSVWDTGGLARDLMIFVQNRCLGEVFDTQVMQRQPLDPRVPQIVRGSDGNLKVANLRGQPVP